jgi:tetratricopeptide (TPR) repeat protein
MNDPIKVLGLANACNGQGNFSEAAKYYKQALSIIHESDDLRPGVMAALAGALQRIDETDEAEFFYKEALAIMADSHSKRSLVLTALAALYTNLGKFAEAEPLYRQAIPRATCTVCNSMPASLGLPYK